MPPPIYILLHRDTTNTTTVLSVFADLTDANAQCLSYAKEAGVTLDDNSGHKRRSSYPAEPLRWDAPDGTSCWVERHAVTPRKILQPPLKVASEESGLQRKNSRLYDGDDDEGDVIEVDDHEGHYD